MSRLRHRADKIGVTNITLLEQNAAAMQVPDESIDLIVSNLGINNFDDVDAVLSACFRVAKPESRFLLTTNLIGHMSEFYDVYRATLRELGQLDRLASLDAHIEHRGTIDTVSAALGKAGFEILHVDEQSFRMRFADGSSLLRHYFIRLGFVPGWKSVAAPDALEPTFEALERNLNAAAAAAGELALTIPMACIEARKPPAEK